VANRKPKPTSSLARQWERGKPLSFAWWDFATKEVRREYQTCQIDSRRMSYRLDTKFGVLDDLVAGKLIALGFRDGAPLEEGPVVIPAHLFPRGGEDTAAIDWDMSVLGSSGFSFARIRVTKPPRGHSRRTKAFEPSKELAGDGPKQDTSTAAPPADMASDQSRRGSKLSNSRMGRPSKDAQIREILQLMKSEGWDFNHRLQKESCRKVLEIAKDRGLDTSNTEAQ
jgi:hypothetical protein